MIRFFDGRCSRDALGRVMFDPVRVDRAPAMVIGCLRIWMDVQERRAQGRELDRDRHRNREGLSHASSLLVTRDDGVKPALLYRDADSV